MTSSAKTGNSKEASYIALVVFLVGMHSIILGLFIYFYTDFFYQTFFGAEIENVFFVRQSGIFLFLAGIFYLYPLLGLKNLYNLILLVILSKTVAVFFLISNAGFTSAPFMIYLAAFFDGLMAVVLAGTYLRCRKIFALPGPAILRTEKATIKETVQ